MFGRGFLLRLIADLVLIVFVLFFLLQHGSSGGATDRTTQIAPAPPTRTAPAGELVRGSGPQVYFIDKDGRKRWITSPEAFGSCGWRWEHIRSLPDTALESIPTGPDIHSC